MKVEKAFSEASLLSTAFSRLLIRAVHFLFRIIVHRNIGCRPPKLIQAKIVLCALAEAIECEKSASIYRDDDCETLAEQDYLAVSSRQM